MVRKFSKRLSIITSVCALNCALAFAFQSQQQAGAPAANQRKALSSSQNPASNQKTVSSKNLDNLQNDATSGQTASGDLQRQLSNPVTTTTMAATKVDSATSKPESISELKGTGDSGENPFGDANLWRLPLTLIHDLSTSPAGGREENYADDNDDDDERYAGEQPSQKATAPTASVISSQGQSQPRIFASSSDLKVAAGYHYPYGYAHSYEPKYGRHYEHYGGDGGHDHLGAHHGDDYASKYYQ